MAISPIPSDEELYTAFANFRSGCRAHGPTGMAYPSDNPVVYMKLIHSMAEPKMQQYAYEQLEAQPPETRRNICIPKVYKVFDYNCIGRNFMVMEYIPGVLGDDLTQESFRDLLGETVYPLIAKALSLFVQLPLPPGITGPGRIGNKHIIHCLLPEEQVSPLVYENVDALQEHFNRLLVLFNPGRVRPPPLSLLNFTNEPLCFCYTDLHLGNFIYNADTGSLYVLDFGHACFLPLSFLSYALREAGGDFVTDIYRYMDPKLGVVVEGPQMDLMADVQLPLFRNQFSVGAYLPTYKRMTNEEWEERKRYRSDKPATDSDHVCR